MTPLHTSTEWKAGRGIIYSLKLFTSTMLIFQYCLFINATTQPKKSDDRQGQRHEWPLIYTNQPFLRRIRPGMKGTVQVQNHRMVLLIPKSHTAKDRTAADHSLYSTLPSGSTPTQVSLPQLQSTTLQGSRLAV